MVLSTYTLQVPQSKLQPWILLDSKHGFAWIYQVSGARELIVCFLLVDFLKKNDFNVCLCSMVSIIKKSSRDPHLFAALKKRLKPFDCIQSI